MTNSQAESEVRAVIAGHGDFAVGAISAVQQISGLGARLHPLSNAGLDAAAIDLALRALLDSTGAAVVFTDLPAGSCTLAARRVARERPGLVVVTGANIAMLLDFVFQDEADAAAAAHAAEKGREAIIVAAPPPGVTRAG